VSDDTSIDGIGERVLGRIRDGRDELVGLLGELIACDTTAREADDEARDEAKLQGILAARLRALGAEVETWEPEPFRAGDSPIIPHELGFAGRPQLVARVAGSGGGRSLLLNGHIDAVPYGELGRWTSHPLKAEIRDGRLYGRGANDMKGAIAAFVHVLECLHAEGVRLAGDVIVATNTDEESTGAGGIRVAERGIRADAGICGEPTGFDVWAACRGTTNVTITVPGRSGHAEMPHPNWRDGGAVNAIEKLEVALGAIRSLREDWRTRADGRHPLLAPPDIVPTMVSGGEWMVTYPDRCVLTCDAQYLPARVEACGWGAGVRAEIEERFRAAGSADPWLAEHPLEVGFLIETVPAEVPPDHDIVRLALAAAGELGHTGRVAGLDSWHDAATFTRFGTPTVSFGPGGFESAHRENEYVPVQDLVDHACAVALVALRFCGV
jgi:acetylornithine deacetylase